MELQDQSSTKSMKINAKDIMLLTHLMMHHIHQLHL